MPRQIQGSQTDFFYGEVDPDLKRADNHPARKGGLRQMSNARIHNSGTIQNRSGRTALYPIAAGGIRTERFTISAGNDFDIQFSPNRLRIVDSSGVTVASFATQGGGAALPWGSAADIKSIVYAIIGMSIYITFGHGMRPQVVSWDGVATWSIADYTELTIGSQKRTAFYRISPKNIAIQPLSQTGVITVTAFNGAPFTPGSVGTRLRYINRQILITGYVSPTVVNALVEEPLPGQQVLSFAIDPTQTYGIGDVVIGGTTAARGIVVTINAGPKNIVVQLLSNTAQTTTTDIFGNQSTFAFVNLETISGPSGSLAASGASIINNNPQPVTFWDEEVMNDFRGYPASCFVDQFRLGFCDFPSVPGGIGWSAINSPTDMYVDATTPLGGMFELAPAKVQVNYVIPGPEGSEFVFCDKGVYYIPISVTNPLKSGSVAFNLLTGDGAAPVQPRRAQEAIIYVNAGGNSLMAIIATGAFLRPFNTKGLTDYHAHLFNDIQCIACPGADGTFNERYAYVLNGDGSIAVGKYKSDSLAGQEPVIGWGPWSGAGSVTWIGSWQQDVLFTTSYFGSTICEILNDTVYMDASLFVNALPAAFAAPPGQGPLWWIPSQTVFLMDQTTRPMGAYQIDANGNIIPQGMGGENLLAASLVAGQIWSGVVEPFAPNAPSGADQHQRMNERAFSYFAAWVIHSTGLTIATLFSDQQTATTPPLGTVIGTEVFPAYSTGEDATLPPIQRETVYRASPVGTTYDPRAAILWDAPGPLQILEIAMEVSL